MPAMDNDKMTMASNTNCTNDISTRDDISADETSVERNDITEQVFEELYQEKCTMSVHQDEIQYVQHKVEWFVSEVIRKVVESETCQNFIHTVDRTGLTQFTEHFREDQLLKTGSFYEDTKNNYPDEFDFIFVLAEGAFQDNKRLRILTSDLSDLFHGQLKDVLSGPSLEIGEVFEECSYTGLHGPASKIKLVFKESVNLHDRTIYVDISVASRVRLGESLPKELKICYDEWMAMLQKNGSLLVIKVYKIDHPTHFTNVKFTITETEQYFLRYEMSERHRKVYRLLKYILNGNHDDAQEELKKLIRREGNRRTILSSYTGMKVYPRIVYDLPSYTIKTLMFHHVHQCKNAENGIAKCLAGVLRHLLALFSKQITCSRSKIIHPGFLKFEGKFIVSVKNMLGNSLDIADDYSSAVVIARRLSRLIETVENVEQTRKAKRSDLHDQIPFIAKNINTVKEVVVAGVRVLHVRNIMFVSAVILMILLFFIIIGHVIVSILQGQACYTNTDTPSNKSIEIQYCCAGTTYRANIWRNVTCLKNNMFSRHTDDPVESSLIELKRAFACMALTVVHNSDVTDDNDIVDYTSAGVRLCEVDESKNKDICLHCNTSKKDIGYNGAPSRNEDQEQGLYTCVAPCDLDTLYHQVNSFLKTKAHTLQEMHYYFKTDEMCRTENLTLNQLQTEANTAREYRTKISSGDANNTDSHQPSDECVHYRNASDTMRTVFYVFGVIALLTFVVRSLVTLCPIQKCCTCTRERASSGRTILCLQNVMSTRFECKLC